MRTQAKHGQSIARSVEKKNKIIGVGILGHGQEYPLLFIYLYMHGYGKETYLDLVTEMHTNKINK